MDEYEQRDPPPSVWLTRSLIVGLIVGVAAAARVIYPHLFMLF